MRETDMFEPMISYLEERGYRVFSVNRGKAKGPDIEALKKGKKLVIEMKGDTSAVKVDWDTGLGQLLQAMDDSGKDYAIAVSQRYERLVRIFPSFPRDRLALRFFIVKESGEVIEV